jgi:heme/copper-type cytochrome/quinol oxidase subunit 1
LGLAYLALGFTFGALMLANKGIPFSSLIWQLLPAHIEFLLIGWVVQLIFGAAFWILPRFSREPKRGNVRLAWLSFILLNLGIWMIVLGPYVFPTLWVPLVGRLLEALAALAFAAHAWPRVRPFGT